ncbi:MAG: gliding motility-associated C-terminal domain-containing protein, partial [bacterium]
ALLGTDVVFLAVPDSGTGTISVGITKKAGSDNVDGFGSVFLAQLISSSDIPDSTAISFSFSRLRAQDKDGNAVQLVPLEEFAIVFQPESFFLRISPTSDTIGIGQRAKYQLSLFPLGGFNKQASLTVRPEFQGISTVLSQLQITPAESAILTLTTDSTAAPGTYVFEAVANADTILKTVPCTLQVVSVPIFPLSVSSEYFSTTPFQIDVQVGVSDKPIKNLHRVEFVLNYDQSEYVFPLFSDTLAPVPGEFFGENASIQFDALPDSGRIKLFAESVITEGVSGYGTVASIPFTSNIATPDNTPVKFTVDGVIAIDTDGQRIFLSSDDYILTIQEKLSISLEVEPDTLTVAVGETAEYLVRAKGSTSFDGTVMLAVAGEPQDASAFFLPTSVSKDQTANLSIVTDTTAAAGIYTLIIRGESGGLTAERQATLIITPAPAFTLIVNPGRNPSHPGDSALYKISVQQSENLQSPVLLNLPAADSFPWLTYSILPTEIDASIDAKLTLFVREDAPLGSFDFQLIGTSGTTTRAARVGLDILEPPPPVRPIPFTPNSDGFNDYVFFEFDELNTQIGEILIFDLNGRKIAELRGMTKWDGKDENGAIAQPGAYLYVVKINDRILKKGVLALAR